MNKSCRCKSPHLLLQATADAQAAQKSGDPAAWKASFVRAMNHVANCSACPTAADATRPAASVAAESVAASHITQGTAASAARDKASREACAAREAAVAEPEWDRSTKVGDGGDREPVPDGGATELLRVNRALGLVHSAQSLQAMIDKQDACVKAAA